MKKNQPETRAEPLPARPPCTKAAARNIQASIAAVDELEATTPKAADHWQKIGP